jgi:tetratricopeptide (TPR) repeat protein
MKLLRRVALTVITGLLAALTYAASTSATDSLVLIVSQAGRDTAKLNLAFKKLAAADLPDPTKTDSLLIEILTRFKQLNYDDGINRVLAFRGDMLYQQGNFQQALEVEKELAQKYLRSKNSSLQLANAYKMIAGSFFNMGIHDSAIVYAEKSISLFKNLNDNQNIARSLNLLGGIYWNMGNLTKASEKLYESLRLREQLNDSLGMANAYNNIGLIYDSQGKLPEAMKMYENAVEIYYKLRNDKGIGRVCNNMAIILKNQKKFSESLEMFLKSLEVDKKLNNIDDQGKTLNNIGQLYIEMGNVKAAIDYYQQARQLFLKSGNENGLAATLLNMGKATYDQKNYAESRNYYLQSLKIAQQINSTEWIRDAYHGLYLLAKQAGRSSEALNLFEHYKSLDDSLRGLENLNKIDQLRVEFETEKKEREISLLTKDNELKTLKLNRQKTYSHLLLTITIAVVAFLGLTALAIKRLRDDKKILIEKNQEIQAQKEEIESQRDLLEVTNAELNQQKEELQTQTDQIERQNYIIASANQRMTESLEYASLIQKSLSSDFKSFDKYFSNCSLLFMPKDIVSGDFFWVWDENNEDSFIFAIADCTGHGVAGAFMSLMAMNLLRDAVGVNNIVEPQKISTYLYNELIRKKASIFDSNLIIGLDFIVCSYSPKKQQLCYSGNHLNFYLVREGEINKLRVERNIDRQSATLIFSQSCIDLQKKDRLYFTTDGFADQISETKRKKIGNSDFQNLLLSVGSYPIKQHSQLLAEYLSKWKGTYEQVDDVLVLGLEV